MNLQNISYILNIVWLLLNIGCIEIIKTLPSNYSSCDNKCVSQIDTLVTILPTIIRVIKSSSKHSLVLADAFRAGKGYDMVRLLLLHEHRDSSTVQLLLNAMGDLLPLTEAYTKVGGASL